MSLRVEFWPFNRSVWPLKGRHPDKSLPWIDLKTTKSLWNPILAPLSYLVQRSGNEVSQKIPPAAVGCTTTPPVHCFDSYRVQLTREYVCFTEKWSRDRSFVYCPTGPGLWTCKTARPISTWKACRPALSAQPAYIHTLRDDPITGQLSRRQFLPFDGIFLKYPFTFYTVVYLSLLFVYICQ